VFRTPATEDAPFGVDHVFNIETMTVVFSAAVRIHGFLGDWNVGMSTDDARFSFGPYGFLVSSISDERVTAYDRNGSALWGRDIRVLVSGSTGNAAIVRGIPGFVGRGKHVLGSLIINTGPPTGHSILIYSFLCDALSGDNVIADNYRMSVRTGCTSVFVVYSTETNGPFHIKELTGESLPFQIVQSGSSIGFLRDTVLETSGTGLQGYDCREKSFFAWPIPFPPAGYAMSPSGRVLALFTTGAGGIMRMIRDMKTGAMFDVSEYAIPPVSNIITHEDIVLFRNGFFDLTTGRFTDIPESISVSVLGHEIDSYSGYGDCEESGCAKIIVIRDWENSSLTVTRVTDRRVLLDNIPYSSVSFQPFMCANKYLHWESQPTDDKITPAFRYQNIMDVDTEMRWEWLSAPAIVQNHCSHCAISAAGIAHGTAVGNYKWFIRNELGLLWYSRDTFELLDGPAREGNAALFDLSTDFFVAINRTESGLNPIVVESFALMPNPVCIFRVTFGVLDAWHEYKDTDRVVILGGSATAKTLLGLGADKSRSQIAVNTPPTAANAPTAMHVFEDTGRLFMWRESETLGNGVYISDDKGRTVRENNPPESFRTIQIRPADDVILARAVIGGPATFHSTDHGDTWLTGPPPDHQ
jgi:hypothetical protein